jgi:YHS domain-containing protein
VDRHWADGRPALDTGQHKPILSPPTALGESGGLDIAAAMCNLKGMIRAKSLIAALLVAAFALGPVVGFAAEQKEKAKPYPLKTCIVSDEKLGEMGEPFTFVYQGQEIKLCCKSCQKDFNKNPEKFLKKLKEAEAKKK